MSKKRLNNYSNTFKIIKFFAVAVILFIGSFSLFCFGREKAQILFNKYRFTQDTTVSPSNTNIFSPGERIYYLITLPKKVEAKMLLVQVLRIGGEGERLGYDLVWGKRVKIRDKQVHYFTDYLVFNTTGAYAMRVYSRDNPTKILTTAYFYVRN